MENNLTLAINEELADQLFTVPENYEELVSHCNGLGGRPSHHEFKITDSLGRTVYTSEDTYERRQVPAVFIINTS